MLAGCLVSRDRSAVSGYVDQASSMLRGTGLLSV